MKLEKLTPMYSYRGNGNFMFELSLKILTVDTFFGDNRGIKDYVSSFLTKECPKVTMKLTFGKSTDNEYDFIYRDTEKPIICDYNIPGTYLCASDLGETPLIIPN